MNDDKQDKKKMAYFDVLNMETGEIETLEMDEEDYLAMLAWEAEYDAEQKKLREGIEAAYEYDRQAWEYARDD